MIRYRLKYSLLLICLIVFAAMLNYDYVAAFQDEGQTDNQENPEPDGKQADTEKIEAARELYKLGMSALSKKQYEAAKEHLSKAISFNPNYIEGYAALGDVYEALKSDELAYENHRRAIELINLTTDPPAELTALRAKLARKTEKLFAYEEKISAVNTEATNALLELGGQCLTDFDYLLAGEIFILALNIDPTHQTAMENMEKIKSELDKENSGDEANSDSQDMAATFYQSGLALMKENKHADAIEKLNRALSYKKNFPAALFRLAECHEKTQSKTEASRNYRRCIKLLESGLDPGDDDKNLLPAALKALEKIDANSAQLKTIRAKHYDKMSKIASELASKKYYLFAARAYNAILAIDPANKNAKDDLVNLPKDDNVKDRDKIFNGTDLSGLVVNTKVWLPLWSVEKPCLIFNREPPKSKKASGEPSLLLVQSKGPLPEDYILSFEVFIEKKWMHAAANVIGFVYGENIQTTSAGNVIAPMRIDCLAPKAGSWETIKFTKAGNKYSIEGPGTSKRNGPLDKYTNKAVGLYAQGVTAKFRNITIKQTK